MANLFTRIKNSVEADLHELMDKQEEMNPISRLNHYLRQSEKEVEQVQRLIQRQYRLKEEMKRELTVAKEVEAILQAVLLRSPHPAYNILQIL